MSFIIIIFIIMFLTFLISTFALLQIIGILLFKLPKKEFNCIVGLILWSGILVGYYLIINKWFADYFYVYLVVSIISFVISLSNINNLKAESQQNTNENSWQKFLDDNFEPRGTRTKMSDLKTTEEDEIEQEENVETETSFGVIKPKK